MHSFPCSIMLSCHMPNGLSRCIIPSRHFCIRHGKNGKRGPAKASIGMAKWRAVRLMYRNAACGSLIIPAVHQDINHKCWSAWEALLAEIPRIAPENLRARISELPRAHLDLAVPATWRAMQVVSLLSHAYVFATPEPAQTLPSHLSEPWSQLSRALDVPPVLTYATYVLYNWRPAKSATSIWDPEDVTCMHTFTGTEDEKWFVAIHVIVETRARIAMEAADCAMSAAVKGDVRVAELATRRVAHGLRCMADALERMPDRCRPSVFEGKIRRFICGWRNNPNLPSGLLYEGVTNEPQKLYGASGAQSSSIPIIDSFLGVPHNSPRFESYLKEMREYMPKEERERVRRAREGPNMREIAEAYGGGVEKAYNECVEELLSFRECHMRLVGEYIIGPMKTRKNNHHRSVKGTGGTDALEYLHGNASSTSKCLFH